MSMQSRSDATRLYMRRRDWRRSRPVIARSIAGLATMIMTLAPALVPVASAAPVQLIVVNVVQVASGYRASKLRGVAVSNEQNQKIGDLDDLVVGRDRVLFAIVQVGGFLGIGSHLIAVPYSSLQINEDGSRIVLPGATREQVKGLPEFKYR